MYAKLPWSVKSIGIAGLVLLATHGMSLGARDDYEEAREKEALLARLTAAYEAGRVEAVARAFEDSLVLLSLTPRLWNLKGLALAGTGRHQEAVAAYEEGIRAGGKLYELHINLGLSLQQLGVTGRAMSEFQRAVEMAPGEVDPRLALGRGYLDIGRTVQARPPLEQAALIDPDDSRVLRELARLSDLEDDLSASIDLWDRLEGMVPGPDTARRLGELHRDSEPELAAAWYELCAARDSLAIDCLAAAGSLWLTLGRTEASLPPLRAAVDAESGDGSSLHNLLMAYQTLGAVDSLEAVVERHPPSWGSSWGVVALSRREAGELGAALKAAYRAVELDPENLELVNILAVLLFEQGERQAARERWEWILERDPEHPQALQNLAGGEDG